MTSVRMSPRLPYKSNDTDLKHFAICYFTFHSDLSLATVIFYEQNKYINGFNARRNFDPKIGPL